MAIVHPRRRLRRELVLVVVVSLAVLVPGIWSYSLVDPWETHYGEVARNMMVDGDLVHMKWPGVSYDGSVNEGFRSKPVLSFWLMAASMRVTGVAVGGGYSGELTDSAWVMVAIRLPFIACAVAGLALMWWMLARLCSRRLAWLGLLVVGSSPMFCLIARQAIPDMPMVACAIGSLALFAMALEDGERPITRFRRLDARHVVLGLAGGFVLAQAIYYAIYFAVSPRLGVRGVGLPAVWLPLLMVVLLGGLSRDGWLIVRLPFVVIGGVISAILREPAGSVASGAGSVVASGERRSPWRAAFDTFAAWERHAPDRYALRVLPVTLLAGLVGAWLAVPLGTFEIVAFAGAILVTAVVWGVAIAAGGWAGTNELADAILVMRPITTMRQLFLLGAYFLLGMGLLAKGPPGFAIVLGVAFFHVVFFHRWKALWDGAFEIKRGALMVVVVAIPWHVAMYLKEGRRFVDEYLYQHILNRAGEGSVDKSLGTFSHYTDQVGIGMWVWAALLPAAIAAALVRANRETREGRVRFLVVIWAVVAVTLFSIIQTKFHHYILPAIPPLALLVAFFLDDILARRERLHPVYALLGAGIVLLVCRDLMFEPDRWIEMFVFRYDRPWPSAEPYAIDPSDGFLGLGIAAALALVVASTRFVRLGVLTLAGAALAICLWALHVYMPIAATHWGMREACRLYYDQRTIYGDKIVYFGEGELADDWRDVGQTWRIETVIPAALQLGQPMTVTVQLNKAEDERIALQELVLAGTATAIGDHTVEITFAKGEREKLDPLIARGTSTGKRGRPPVRAVDADRLVAFQLYWRGEQFWSAGEIWGWMPEMKTSFPNNPPEFTKYINDRSRAPLGRRYFVLTQSGHIGTVRNLLPTQRAKDSFDVLDTTSNKFTLAAFDL